MSKFYKERKCGAGYYALRKNVSRSGNVYYKLVKADRSGSPMLGMS